VELFRSWLRKYPLFAEQVGMGILTAWLLVPLVVVVIVALTIGLLR
jgi:hypothetical protein